MASPLRLFREAGQTRRSMIAFALLTAVLNGFVTASVGAWLGRSYTSYLARREAVQSLADLVYERRARAGLVVSSLRRSADLDELRYRKRAYDDVFVEWNKRIQNNMLQIRDLIGSRDGASLESVVQQGLVPALQEMDACLTKGYDVRLMGQDPLPVVEGCRFQVLHQFTLDCAKSLTDELHRLTRLTFVPFFGASRREVSEAAERARGACTRQSNAGGN